MEYNNPVFDRTGTASWHGQETDMAKVSATLSPPSHRDDRAAAPPSSQLHPAAADGDLGKVSLAEDGPDAAADGEDRETWSKKVDFLLSVIGFAVDLGNVWRFPYICHRNGGGAFLVPYFIMVIFGGIPLCYMELSLGQYHRLGPLKIWTKICPLFKGMGYAMILVGMYTSFYYNTIIAWAVFYFFSSFTSELPWRSCNNTWNTDNCTEFAVDTWRNNSVSAATEFLVRNVYEYQNSNGLSELGYIRWQIALCLALVFVIVYFSLWKGIHMSGKVVWVTATLPYVLLLILMVRGVTLPGADRGILYFLTPKWETLASPSVWWDAAAQVFFSLGPGFGVLITLSSYNRFHNNTCRDAVATSLMNCLASLLSGFVIFSVLGYISVTQNREIENIAVGGPGLLFEVYAEAIASMDGATGWSLIFFFMLINLGVDSTFGGLETVITSLSDEYPRVLRRHRELFVLGLVCVCYTGALVTTTNGGVLVVHLMDTFAANTSITIVVLLEVTIVCWIYGTDRLSCEMQEMMGTKPALPWRICWTFICPIILAITIVLGLVYYESPVYGDYVYPGWAVGVGWGITGSSLVCIPLYAMYKFIMTPGTLQQRARHLLFMEDSEDAPMTEIAENGRASPMEFKGLVAQALPNSNV
ncbi:sodium-dependent serotonin transporter-like [Branchiostoma floridae x Branchiostoma japonicum]